VRRKAQLLAHRPDLRVVNFRGNVDTRLRKLEAGEVDATLLALAGLRRLGIEDAGIVLSPEEMLPAVGQGALGIECRADDGGSLGLLAAIDHPASSVCVRAERALLAALDGSCHTPIAGHAEIAAGRLHLRALIARPDGSACLRAARVGMPGDAEWLGHDAGTELKARADPGFFD
jgi:hydroxymethylbilane synthase